MFHKTYHETRAPGRLANVGLTLLGPTVMAFGTPLARVSMVSTSNRAGWPAARAQCESRGWG